MELKAVWSDPDFQPGMHAFYYARALEIPTPRWTTIQAAQLGIALPDVVEPTVQERAWGSPIWYTPTAEARRAEQTGTTVADLKKQGATQLDDAGLRALVEQKSIWFQNRVTGDKYMIIYSALGKGASPATLTPDQAGYLPQQFPANQGHFQVRYVGRNVSTQSLVGDVAHAGRIGATRTYNIKDGRIQTDLVGTPIEIAVYKLGDRYLAARNNEFGYANYEIVPVVSELSPLSAESRKP